MSSVNERVTRGQKRKAETDGNDSDDSVIILHNSPRYKQGNVKAPIDIDSDSDDGIVFVPQPARFTTAGRAGRSPQPKRDRSDDHTGRTSASRHIPPAAPLAGTSRSGASPFRNARFSPQLPSTPSKKQKAGAVRIFTPEKPNAAGPSNHAALAAPYAPDPLFLPQSSPPGRLSDVGVAQLPPLPASAFPSPPPLVDPVPRAPTPEPIAPAGPPSDLLDPNNILMHVLEILPNIAPEYALRNIQAHLATGHTNRVAEVVVDRALEVEGGYPKVKIDKGKGKAEPEENSEQYKLAGYRAEERKGYQYQDQCLRELELIFASIPVGFIRQRFQEANSLLVPAYYLLLEKSRLRPLPYAALLRPRKAKAPVRFAVAADDVGRVAFEREQAWLDATICEYQREKDEEDARQKRIDAAIANGEGIECACCFGDDIVENMLQCEDGHLFCKDCTIRNAETKLGEQITDIVCMDTSGCKSPFPESELKRSLSTKTLDLYHRLKQSKELELAAIDGLESCPSCDFSAIIDNPNEKLFRCMNESCEHVTCRKCRRPEHIPKTCEEMDAENKLDHRHAVEDAMSAALIRRCPKCTKPFIKESGCNKIVCTSCRTISCYICRQIIQDYEHFDRNPANYAAPIEVTRCVLWDKDANPDEAAIMAARDAAAAEARAAAARDGINLEDKDLYVALPDRAPQAAPLYGQIPARLPGHPFRPDHMPHGQPLPLVPAQQALWDHELLRHQAAFEVWRRQQGPQQPAPLPARPPMWPHPQLPAYVMPPGPQIPMPRPLPVAARQDPMVQEMNRFRALRQARGVGAVLGIAPHAPLPPQPVRRQPRYR